MTRTTESIMIVSHEKERIIRQIEQLLWEEDLEYCLAVLASIEEQSLLLSWRRSVFRIFRGRHQAKPRKALP